jgi:hypothetical protein
MSAPSMTPEAIYRRKLRKAKRAIRAQVECARHGCANHFRPTRASHLYCSARCKVAAHRGRIQVTQAMNGRTGVTDPLKAHGDAAMLSL